MPALDQPPPPAEPRDADAERHNARLGLALFAVYLAAYGAFVLLNAFWPELMDAVVVAGLNLAVVWGLGLIVGALALALVYAQLCRTPAGAPK
jgi:uncharacterized membrane protein (DUF485 family)